MAIYRSLAVAALIAVASADPKSCPSDTPLSCHNTTAVQDTCCFIPSGQLLLTQFWDTDPATGPDGKSSLPYKTSKIENKPLTTNI